ncbi:hypothetical protein [Providencia rustigianii]|uniref:DUF4440 domain-containing protein n=1 Tax=Providencia rustigianii DSM 4541 TaxID=500637 RepID=D1P1L0_9GAMM|nr:hypothetical protein [Providencia rustigianii]EFB72796.1 hypothetical protein PROVRUST_06081 [Providencia rustigianii DSM 4541]SUC28384.1 Uncharacterized protein conserved in bacteria [Providencia rustigianii]
MDQQMALAVQSIIDVHVLIEDVFTGRHQGKSLQPLLASFDKDFKMVTIQGACIGLEQVTELFSHNVGAKPSLDITVQNIEPLFESSDNQYWLRYQEYQTVEGLRTLRTSTVGLKIEAGKCYWQYLHETPVK